MVPDAPTCTDPACAGTSGNERMGFTGGMSLSRVRGQDQDLDTVGITFV